MDKISLKWRDVQLATTPQEMAQLRDWYGDDLLDLSVAEAEMLEADLAVLHLEYDVREIWDENLADVCQRRDVLELVVEVVDASVLDDVLLSVDRLGSDAVHGLMEHLRGSDPWLAHRGKLSPAPGWWIKPYL